MRVYCFDPEHGIYHGLPDIGDRTFCGRLVRLAHVQDGDRGVVTCQSCARIVTGLPPDPTVFPAKIGTSSGTVIRIVDGPVPPAVGDVLKVKEVGLRHFNERPSSVRVVMIQEETGRLFVERF